MSICCRSLLAALFLSFSATATGAQIVALGGELQLNETTFASRRAPDVVALTSSKFLTVWDGRWTTSGRGRGLWGRTFDQYGVPQGSEFFVTKPLSAETDPAPLHEDAVLGSLNDGRYVVVWNDEGEVDGDLHGIFVAVYDSNNASLTGEVGVNDIREGDQGYPDLAVNSQGEFVVVWQDSGQNYERIEINAQRFDTDGAKIGSNLTPASGVDASPYTPRVAALADDSFMVVWSQHGDGDGRGIS